MTGTQVVRLMRMQTSAAIADRVSQHDELRQVVVKGAQSVMHPRPDTGKDTITDMAARVKLQLGAMIIISRPHGTNHCYVVNAFANIRPPVRNLYSALSLLSVSHLHGEYFLTKAAFVVFFERPEVLLNKGIFVDFLVGSFRKRLPRIFVQCRLGIETLHLAHPA